MIVESHGTNIKQKNSQKSPKQVKSNRHTWKEDHTEKLSKAIIEPKEPQQE